MAEGPVSAPNLAGPDVLEDLLSRHGPPDARSRLGASVLQDLRDEGAATVQAAVVVGDLRMSGLLLKEAVDASLFARYIVGFTEAVRSLANGFDGWFDKFTGDGFIAFWLYEDEGAVIDTVPGFCQAVVPAAQTLIANLKRNSRNFPVGVGLALGVDAGSCQLVRVGGVLTLLGSPIVGATRMVSGARAGETLVNVGLGASLERLAGQLESAGVHLERREVRTKEYPEGQEAYELSFASAPRAAPA